MIKNGKALKESVGIVDEVLTASSDAEKSELLYLKASAKLLLGQTDIAGELLQLTSLGGDWRFRTEILQKEWVLLHFKIIPAIKHCLSSTDCKESTRKRWTCFQRLSMT